MSMVLDIFYLMASLAKPATVELSELCEVGGWVCPCSARVVLMGMAYLPLRKVAPISSSVAEAVTLEKILERVKMGPLMDDSPEGG